MKALVLAALLLRDSNGDGVFRTNDAMEVVRYELATGQLSPLVDPALIDRAVKITSLRPATLPPRWRLSSIRV